NREGAERIYPPKSVKNAVQFVWRWGREKALKNLNEEIIGYKTNEGEYRIVQKMRHSEKIIRSMLSDTRYSSRRGTSEVEALFNAKIFDFPKPLGLLLDFVRAGSSDDGIILDFFAGSATTAHAVMQLNAEDGGNRRFIMVQLPEPCDEKSEAARAGYRNICEIGRERIRRAGKAIAGGKKTADGGLWASNETKKSDTGFRVFKLASSNIRAWEPDRDNLAETLMEHAEHLKTDRSEQDILFELLLKLGLDLTTPIEQKNIADKTVHGIGGGTLIVCLAERIAAEEVEPLALGISRWHQEHNPAGETTVVFRDSAFADDLAKTNLTAILQQHNLENVRSI
ncbi:MAG: site-specific DNA-methyltransferase, partial [Phycisphaerales bacterium]|nr:site-specific DNA-methyltransferase [Phycisphaerales bacterium]